MNLLKTYTKEEKSWILQDWANSVYSLMITTAVFPIYFKTIATNSGISGADSTAFLGYTNSLATIFVGLLAPILGAIADYKGLRMPMFTISTIMGIGSVLGMIFVNEQYLYLLLLFYGISSIGFASANIFYDSSIMDVTTSERIDKVSAAGFGFGYIGSTIPFILFMLLMNFSGLSNTIIVKLGFFITGLWWFIFTIPYWKNVHQLSYIERHDQLVVGSFKRLFKTVRHIKEHKQVFLFLLAYFFYIDGVGTIIKMATTIGADMGLSSSSMIGILLLVQFVAFPFSIFYGYLAKRIGSKNTLFIGILTYACICVLALFLSTITDFLILAVCIGTAQGGVQAISRSIFGQIIPANRSNEFFGFYNIFGKFSSVLGTTLIGITSQLTGNSLDGVFSLIILFIIGGTILFFVKIQPENQATN